MTSTIENLHRATTAALAALHENTPDQRVRPEPYVAAIACYRLFVDRSYQRDLDESRVRRMVADFDRTLLGVIEVSDRGRVPRSVVAAYEAAHQA